LIYKYDGNDIINGGSKNMKQKDRNLNQVINKLITSFVGIDHEQFDTVINQALRSIGEFFDADRVYLFDYDFQAMTCSNTYEWCASNIEPMIDTLQNSSLDGLDHWVASHLNGKETYIANVKELDENDQVRKILEPQHVLSLLTIPLMNNRTCYGFLGIDSVKETRTYTDAERETLIKFGEVLTLFQQKQSNEKKLIETQLLLMSILDNQKEYVCRINRSTNKIVYANQSFLDDIGTRYSLFLNDDLFKSELFSIVHVHEFISHFSSSNKKLVFEQEIFDSENIPHMIMWEFYPLEFEDEIQVVGFNISYLKKALGDTEKHKEKLHHLQQTYTFGSWEYDVVLEKFFVDDAFAHMLGYKKEEINEFDFYQLSKLVSPKDLEKVIQTTHEVLGKKLETFDVSLTMNHKDDHVLEVRTHGYTKTKKYRSDISKIIGFVEDVTFKNQVDKDLMSYQRLADLQDDIIFMTDENNVLNYINYSFMKKTGYSSKDVIGHDVSVFIHADYNQEAFHALEISLSRNENYRGVIVIETKENELIPCDATISPIKGQNEETYRIISIYRCVLEEK